MSHPKIPPRGTWVVLIAILAVGLINCGGALQANPTPNPTARPQATPNQPEATAGVKSNSNPANGTATPDLTPIVLPTFVPNDPNLPVSNDSPITPVPLPNRTQIYGRITDSAGKPIARAVITIPKASKPVPEMAYLSDANGNYKLSVPYGEFTIAVNAEGFAPSEQDIETKTDPTLELNWVLKPS